MSGLKVELVVIRIGKPAALVVAFDTACVSRRRLFCILNVNASNGVVIAVNESLTVGGGTFNTVKYHGIKGRTDPAVQSTNIWVSIADGIMVKDQNLDANGNVVSTVELSNLQ